MNKPKLIFSTATFLFVCLLSFTTSFAQTPTKQQSESSYEVVLQVLIASNSAADKSAVVSQTLSNVVKKLKANYTFSNYRVASTYLQRVANTGDMQFKGISNEPNQNVYAPIFSEWMLGRLTNMPDSNGQNSISIQNFRFGQRVPVKTATFRDDNGKSNDVTNYESVGLTMQKLSLPINTPTTIGNLSTSKSDEMMFLVLTVKPVED
jgi:hypothetical protein